MFPTIRVSFSGLDNKASYLILLDIVTVDNKRYRYAYHRSSWLVAGKGDPAHHSKLYSHPDSPFLGEQLRKQIITFEKVKLTNTEVNKPGYVCSFKQSSNFQALDCNVPFSDGSQFHASISTTNSLGFG